MALYVQKFGGTSVADPERISEVVDHVRRTVGRGDQVVVVVSAMGKETDELLRLADDVSTVRPGREMDMLLEGFARAHVDGFDDECLGQLEALLENSDPELMNWISGRETVPPERDTAVMRLFLDFKLNFKLNQ